MQKEQVIEEFDIYELEQRVEFGLCGGGVGDGGSGGQDPGTCSHTPKPCSAN